MSLADKSTNNALGTAFVPLPRVPLFWLIDTDSVCTDTVNPLIPTRSALPTLALSAVHFLRSTPLPVGAGAGVPGVRNGCGTDIIAKAKFTPRNDRPTAASLVVSSV